MIKRTQPVPYQVYIAPYGGIQGYLRRMRMPGGVSRFGNIPKPKPSFSHFRRSAQSVFDFAFGLFHVDRCNACRKFDVLELQQDDMDMVLLETVKKCQAEHLLDADFKIQLNKYLRKFCERSFEGIDIKYVKGTTYTGTSQYLQYDHDQCAPEIERKENDFFYKSPIDVINMSIVMMPSTPSGTKFYFSHSRMHGGKKSVNTIEALNYAITHFGIGAENLIFNNDNALRTQEILKWAAWTVHPDNPSQKAKSALFVTLAVGHTWMICDQSNRTTRRIWGKKDSFKNCEERVRFLNSKGTIQATQLKEFHEPPVFFEDLFLPLKDWKDQYGNPCNIKIDPAVTYGLGRSLIDGEWVYHPTEMWTIHNRDFSVDRRRYKIMKVNPRDLVTESNPFLLFDIGALAAKPVIPINKFEDTLAVCKMFDPDDCKWMTEYYKQANIGEAECVDAISGSVESRVNTDYLLAKMQRQMQIAKIMETKQNAPLTPMPRRSQGDNGGPCAVPFDDEFPMLDVMTSYYTKPVLQAELKRHGLTISGNKPELISRLSTHYLASHVFAESNDD